MTAVTPDLIAVKALDGYKLDLVFAAALRGVIRLPEDFDEREYKSKRLANRLSDYTEWQRDHLFDGETVDTLVDKIRAFEGEHSEVFQKNISKGGSYGRGR